MNKWKRWMPYCLLGFLGFGLSYLVPFLRSLQLSLLADMFSKVFTGFENYLIVLKNAYFRLALRNTMLFAVMSVTLSLGVAVILAYELSRLGGSGSFIRAGLVLPTLIPVAAIMEEWSFWREYGGGEKLLANLPILLLFLWKNVGLITLILEASFQRISGTVIDAARVDGAGELLILRKILIPALRPQLLFAGILLFSKSMGIYRESKLYFRSDYPPKGAYLLQYYMNNHFEKLEYEILAASTVILVGIVFLVVLFFYTEEKRLLQN